jgi:hypothetical protein
VLMGFVTRRSLRLAYNCINGQGSEDVSLSEVLTAKAQYKSCDPIIEYEYKFNGSPLLAMTPSVS